MSAVRVCCRLRPLNKREKSGSSNHIPVVTTNKKENSITIVKGLGNKSIQHRFHVDEVYGSFSEQAEIFENSVLPLVTETLKGFESTCFAYGQTGTGKTYTMEGDITSEQHAGVIPRSVQAIFNQLAEPQYIASTVSCSYLEIYNEELSDLLIDETKTAKALRICATSRADGGRVICMGLSKISVNSPQEVINVLNEARERRQIGETKMNKQSSRSHCLFTIQVESTEQLKDGNTMERKGKLHLVDLAGSECAKSTGAQSGSTRMRESQNINKSLLTLGRVISTLRSGGGRVPYRDSKLTRLLQEALGGRSKTLIIATLSPSILSIEESLSTLSYAEQAHGIVNKPIEARARMQINTSSSSSNYGSTNDSKHQAGEVSSRTFVEMEARLRYYESQCAEAQHALATKHLQVSEMAARATEAESQVELVQQELVGMQQKLVGSQKTVTVLKKKTKNLKLDLKKTQKVVEKRRETEIQLTNEASSLLSTLSNMELNNKENHSTLSNMHERDQSLRNIAQETSAHVEESVSVVLESLNHYVSDTTNDSTETIDTVSSETKTSMLEMARNLNLVSNENIHCAQKLAEQLQTWIGKDIPVLAGIQRTLANSTHHLVTETIETTLPNLRDGSKQALETHEKAAQQEEDKFSKWVCQDVLETTSLRTKERKKENVAWKIQLNENEKHLQKDISQTSINLNKQKERINTLFGSLQQQEEHLMNHHIQLQNMKSHVSQRCSENVKQMDETQVQFVELQNGTLNETKTNIETHATTLCSTLLEDIDQSKLKGALTSLSKQHTKHLKTTLKVAKSNTVSSHKNLSENVASIKNDVWCPFEEDHESRKQKLDLKVADTLNNGRKGNLFQSHSISIRNLSNRTVEQLEDQRDRLTTGCVNVLMSSTENHRLKSTNLSEHLFDLCQDVKEKTEHSLTEARQDIATTMDTLEHVVEIHASKREAAMQQHAHVLGTMSKKIQTASKSHSKIVSDRETILSTIMKEQKIGRELMVSSIMETVQKMLSESTQKMSDDLNARMCELRAQDILSTKTTEKIDSALETGSSALQETVSFWNDNGSSTDTTLRETVREDLHSLHDHLGELESDLCNDVKTLTSHLVERDIADETVQTAMDNSRKCVALEIEQHSLELSKNTSEAAEDLLEESEQWNASVSSTHTELENIHQHVSDMSETFRATHTRSTAKLDQVSASIDHFQKENLSTESSLSDAIVTSKELTKELTNTSKVLNKHVKKLNEETSTLQTMVTDVITRVSTLTSRNSTLKEHIVDQQDETSTKMNNVIQKTLEMKGDDLNNVENSNLQMQASVQQLESDNSNVIDIVSNTSTFAANCYSECVNATEQRNEKADIQDNTLTTSTNTFMQSHIKSRQASSVSHRASIEHVVATSIDIMTASLRTQQTATSEANVASSEVRRKLEEKTREIVSEKIATQHNAACDLLSDHTENVDVCMTSMENRTTTTTSSMRIGAKDHATEIKKCTTDMKNQHFHLCENEIQMNDDLKPLKEIEQFVWSNVLSFTEEEKTIRETVTAVEEEEEEVEEEEMEKETGVVVANEEVVEEAEAEEEEKIVVAVEIIKEQEETAMAKEAPVRRTALLSLDKNIVSDKRRTQKMNGKKSTRSRKSGIPRGNPSAPSTAAKSRMPVPPKSRTRTASK